MVSMFFWAAFGGIIGWIGAFVQYETSPRRGVSFIVAGILGGLLGGYGGALIDAQQASQAATDIIFAVFGATTLVMLLGYAASKQSG